MIRKVIHIDMDAFFASVEQRDYPELRGKPVVVGGTKNRGVVAAASYEARKYGIKSAMPIVTAIAKCPGLIIVKPNGRAYKEASGIIRSIFLEYTDAVEPLSLDEAFLDVTFQKSGPPSATLIAKEIKKKIKERTQLTASAGVSYNKFLAKVASDYKKPDGLFVITPEEALVFLEKLSIDKFYGVGKVSAQKFHELGVHTGADLRKCDQQSLKRWFGKAGEYYYNIVRGIDNRDVSPIYERKSIGAEQTFEKDTNDQEELIDRLLRVIDRMWSTLERKGAEGKTITLKIKFFDFEVITRSHTLNTFVFSKDEVIVEATGLLKKEFPIEKPIRLLGVTLSNFRNENQQPSQMILNL